LKGDAPPLIEKINKLEPSLKALIFSLYPLVYYLFDILNYSQAGKAAVLGFFTLATLYYWREILPKRSYLTVLLSLALLLLSMNIAFQATVRDIFGIQQDDTVVIQSIFNTNNNEASEFFIQYARQILVHVVIVAAFCVLYWVLFIKDHITAGTGNRARKTLRGLIVTVMVTFLLVAIHFNPALRRANPLYYFPHFYLVWQKDLQDARQIQESLASTAGDESLASMHLTAAADGKTVVFVIGESDTRKDWSLYGYPRKTNPELEKHKDDLVVFRDVISADGSTIGSITKMLSPATMDKPRLWISKPNIVTIARHLGYKVFWITNQGTVNRGIVSVMASQADEVIFTNSGGSRGESSLDEVVLDPYEKALDDPAGKKLIVVHILGAHPSYNFRYPERYARFEDVYDDEVAVDLKNKHRAPWAISFRNMYDSAILYEDYVLSQLLERLMKRNIPKSAWMYIADHGQDVAHHTNFSGHNPRVKEMWEVPMLLWESSAFKDSPISHQVLEKRTFRADIIDHTILGLLGAQGEFYIPQLDLTSVYYDPEKYLGPEDKYLNLSAYRKTY